MLKTRYRRIVLYFAKVVSSLVVWELILPKIGFRGISRRTRSKRLRNIAVGFRSLAIEMGGVLIKVGQFLSTRVDVLPQEITVELSGLQDEVPPEFYDDIRLVAEDELGLPLSQVYLEFDREPLAAASLGQVHRAKIDVKNGGPGKIADVVVKIQRPKIKTIIATDLAALRTVGGWLKRYPPIMKRADIPALLEEFTRILYDEIDYLKEGRNAEVFATNFRRERYDLTVGVGQPGVRVPRVIWSHTTERVLTLEDVYAIKITDYDAITESGIKLSEVADHLFNTYLRQIFDHGFFHADPHPGNLFVSPNGHKNGKRSWDLTFVDFGMVGQVPENLNTALRELVIATGTQDPARMVRSYLMLGILLPSADLDLIEQAEAKAFERFWGKSMAELRNISFQEMQEFAREFRQLIFSMPFQIPQDMILLGRTVAILSGMCMGLYPDFNVWKSIKPFANRLIAEETLGEWNFWRDELEQLLKTLLNLPRKLDRVLDKLEAGEVILNNPERNVQSKRLNSALNRVTGGIVFASLIISGVQLILGGYIVFGKILLGISVIPLFFIILRKNF